MKFLLYNKRKAKFNANLAFLFYYTKVAGTATLICLAAFTMADPIAMNILQKQVLVKLSNHWKMHSNLISLIWTAIRNHSNKLLNNTTAFNSLYYKDNIN